MLITVDPYLPVPPVAYGGIERIVDMLVLELATRGHEVTMVAHPESHTAARLIPYGAPPHEGWARWRELFQVGSVLWQHRRQVDIVHGFGRLAALFPILPLRRLPKIQSYQRAIPWEGVRKAVKLAGRSIHFTSCSASMLSELPQLGAQGGSWTPIFNGVDTRKYQLTTAVAADAPLMFLGRLERIKGVHTAIAIARRSGRRLIIAGNRVPSPEASRYFDEEIAPAIDGQSIEYIGPVDDVRKNELLGRSAALLMPIEWDEPFGIVMAESLACGTPVIGFPRGSVPEVVLDGVNGFVAGSVEEAAAAVGRLTTISRSAVRRDCEVRMSHTAIADAYERLYYQQIASVRGAPMRPLTTTDFPA